MGTTDAAPDVLHLPVVEEHEPAAFDYKARRRLILKVARLRRRRATYAATKPPAASART